MVVGGKVDVGGVRERVHEDRGYCGAGDRGREEVELEGTPRGLLELDDLGEDVDGGLEEVTDLEFVV